MARTRREFLASASAAALVLATHERLAWAAIAGEGEAPTSPAAPLLAGLRLQTAAPLDEMKAFYAGRLGLDVLAESEDELTVAGGATAITFERAKPGPLRPFYHFAFNIPENKIGAARKWQLERSPLLPGLPRLRDPEFPEDVVHFAHWNAHSVFFLDPAENVVEYIARHDLGNAAGGAFDASDILYASEIGLVVDDVPFTASSVGKSFDLAPYRGGSDEFTALGDEHGLLLVFARGRTLSFGRPEPKKAEVFPVEATIHATKGRRFRMTEYPYAIVNEAF